MYVRDADEMVINAMREASAYVKVGRDTRVSDMLEIWPQNRLVGTSRIFLHDR